MSGLIGILFAITLTQQPPKRIATSDVRVIEVIQCLRVPAEKPNSTGLHCGWDEKGEPLILSIPETSYQFPEGKIFRLYVYSNGHQEFPVDKQPKGSVVIKTPPCSQPVFSYRQRGLQAPPCNPDQGRGR